MELVLLLSFPLVSLLGLLGHWLGKDIHQNRFLPSSVDLLTIGAHDLSRLLETGVITSTQLVEEYLHRIELDNSNGLQLRAVISLAPRDILLAIARARDDERIRNATRSPLHGIPLLVKVLVHSSRRQEHNG